jgi:uncharacterized protein YbjQ (UPF0145 family)
MNPGQLKVLAQIGAVLLLIGLAAAALYGSYNHGVTVTELRWQAQQSDQAALQAKALVARTTENRTEEQRRQTAVNEVANDSKEQGAAAAIGIAAASAAADGLRSDTARVIAAGAGVPGDPGLADRGEATRRAALVLSGLLDRSVARNRELAKGFDDARRAGLTCERAWASLTK